MDLCVVDARGREARLSREPGPRGSRAGSPERPVIRPTEKPARPAGRESPPRLRSGSVPGATADQPKELVAKSVAEHKVKVPIVEA